MAILSIDLVIVSFLTFFYVKIKNFKPDWFFPPSGLTFFLPPEENDLKELRQDKELSQKKMNSFQRKKFSKKPTLPLKVMKANYVHMQKLPFFAELDLTMLFFIVITCHLIITQFLKYISDIRIDSNFSLYLCLILLLMILYNVFRMITLNGFQLSVMKIYIICALIYSLVVFLLFFGFREFLFFHFEREFQRLNSHMSSVIADLQDFNSFSFSFELFLFLSILFAGLFTFVLLPSIARFGENYVKIIGQYYDIVDNSKKVANTTEDTDKNEENSNKPGESSKTEENTSKTTEKPLKKDQEQENKVRWVLKIFNLRLIFNLLILFFWVKPMMSPWVSFLGSEEAIVLLRLLFSFSYCVVVAIGYRYEIEMHFTKIYETIKSLLIDPGNENLRKVQVRVSNLVQTSLMVSYIIVSKFLIPLLLIYIIIYKSNYNGIESKMTGVFRNYPIFLKNQSISSVLTVSQKNDFLLYASDWNCMVSRDIRNTVIRRICPFTQKQEIVKVGLGLGVYACNQKEEDFYKMLKELLRKINNYGLIPDEFYRTVLSFWLFNYFFANYFLTVFYIIFLRKSANF